MLHITDAMVESLVSPKAARETLRAAFASLADGRAAMQERVRTEVSGIKLSTLGAVIPDQEVVGAKVYTTIKKRFTFIILLFSAKDGRPLATFDAGAITRLRTAACSVLAAQKLALPHSRVLGLFGTGIQGFEHAVQFCSVFPIESVLVNDSHAPDDAVRKLAQATGVKVEMAPPHDVARCADIVVTATRSATALFDGHLLRPGAFVAAIGSSLPTTRELDDEALRRAQAIVVEWKAQALQEAGDLVMADPQVRPDDKIFELASVLRANSSVRQSDADILIYKSVGIGLEDIALAGLAYRQATRMGRH